MDRKAIWLAAAVSVDSGLRPCNVTLKDGKDKKDHCVRAKDMLIKLHYEEGRKGRSGEGRNFGNFWELGTGVERCLEGGYSCTDGEDYEQEEL